MRGHTKIHISIEFVCRRSISVSIDERINQICNLHLDRSQFAPDDKYKGLPGIASSLVWRLVGVALNIICFERSGIVEQKYC